MTCLVLFVIPNPFSLRRLFIFFPRPTVAINNVAVLTSHAEAKGLMLILFEFKICVLVSEKYWTLIITSRLFSTSKFVVSTIL